ncbi:MAG: hypothetical protein EZS28_016627 [Streblomastix strix]|uniref:Uncharacterized protein n=1 Tax=Streblomastix strix TaxID=222440 RepID=A0A5J4VZ62_9EUKA|nr:MAG: hypothetical protein EZS28_016627 [Streblomastix strix]
MHKAYDMNRMQFVQGDTDSLTWAISANPNRNSERLFEEVIKDQGFFDRYKDCVFSENGKKQILHITVGKYDNNCFALSPINYIINNETVLKGVVLDQNPQIIEQTFVDCVNKGTIATAINTTLSRFAQTDEQIEYDSHSVQQQLTRLPNTNNGIMKFAKFVSNMRITPSQEEQNVSINHADEIQINGKTLFEWFEIYYMEAKKYNARFKRARPIRSQDSGRSYVTKQIQRINQPQKPLSLFPFKSKIKQYEKINKVKITQETQIKDIKAKPLNKLQCPYFSPKLGSLEIDLVFGVNPVTRRKQHYLFVINIYTKYLVAIPLVVDEQNATPIDEVPHAPRIDQTSINTTLTQTQHEQEKIEFRDRLKKYSSQEEAERIAAEQRSYAQQKYRIQRQEFRASANNLQLLSIRRLQKTIITNVQDLLQISDIIDRYNQPNNQ